MERYKMIFADIFLFIKKHYPVADVKTVVDDLNELCRKYHGDDLAISLLRAIVNDMEKNGILIKN